MRFPPLALAAGIALVGACAHRTREPNDKPAHDPDLITADEMAGINASTVYDAVQHLRPAWILRSRPNPALPSQFLIIYVDGQRLGSGIDALRTLPVRSAYSVEFLSPSKAQGRFGPGHNIGAIEVLTNPR